MELETLTQTIINAFEDSSAILSNPNFARNTIMALEKLIIEDIVEGTGPGVAAGDRISVHYTGKFEDGTVFDSSVERGEPIDFTCGVGMVIPGWDQGLIGLKKGGKRRLSIPYALAYGEAGYPGAIPPKADLYFDVELVGIK